MKIERALKFVPVLVALFLGASVTPVSATLLTFNSKYVVTDSTTAVTSTSTTLADDTPASQTFTLAASQTVLVIYNAFNNNGSTEYTRGKQIAINVDTVDYANTWNSPNAAKEK
jgi:predicted anti-sigma-YlaC factor YlaD